MDDGKDIPCVICGYDLRGLSAQARCPECGAEVGRSLHGDLLEYADFGWVLSLRRGSALIAWSINLFLAGWVVVFGLGMLLGSLGVLSARSPAAKYMNALFPAVAVVSSVMLCWGVWLFTRQEPRELGVEEQTSVRRLTRAAVILVVLLLSLRLVLVFGSFARYVDGAALLAFICASAGAARRVHHLAPRLPAPKLEQKARGAARRLLPGTAGAIGIGVALYAVSRVSSSSSPAMIVFMTVGVLAAACLIMIPFISLAEAFAGLRDELGELVRTRRKRESG